MSTRFLLWNDSNESKFVFMQVAIILFKSIEFSVKNFSNIKAPMVSLFFVGKNIPRN